MTSYENSSGIYNLNHAEPLSERKLEELFQQFEPELLGTLCHLLGNREDARDALQEGFVRCWKNRHQLSEIGNLRAWIFRVVYNVGLDMTGTAWRKRRKSMPAEDLYANQLAKTPLEQCVEREELDRVRDAIQQLGEPEKAIFLLRQNGSLTYEQIARIIGIPTGTVKTKMRTVLSKLQQKLNRPSSLGGVENGVSFEKNEEAQQ